MITEGVCKEPVISRESGISKEKEGVGGEAARRGGDGTPLCADKLHNI